MSSQFVSHVETRQLMLTIKRLEARISQLEKIISASANEVALKVGSSSILMKPSSIDIKSKDVTISGSGKINVKASGDLVLKGSKILQN